MKLAFLGLGKMGSRMVKKLLTGRHEVVVWNRSIDVAKELEKEVSMPSLHVASSIQEAVESLSQTKIIWMMLPAGSPTQSTFEEVLSYVSPKDIIIDGGNAYFKDTEKRFEQAKEKNVRFLGIGVSGGIKAAENGFPLMIGGDKSAYKQIKPILDTFAVPHGGHDYFGEGGAGHFIKMVHNGIEYGMMQSIAEGFGVLEKSSYHFDLLKVASIWQKGTIISSFLIDCAREMLAKDSKLTQFAGPIGENGEAKWAIEEAERSGIKVPVIQDSLQYRLDSQKDHSIQHSFIAKMVNALRNSFGGHSIP